MKVSIFGGNLLKKGVKIIKKAVIGVMSVAVILSTASGCLGHKVIQNGERSSYNESPKIDYSYTNENVSEDNSDYDYRDNSVQNTSNYSTKGVVSYNDTIDTSRDISDDYVSVFVGDVSSGVVVASSENIVRYKNSSNAYTREASGMEDSTVSMSEENYRDLVDFLDDHKTEMPYSELFNVEHLMEKDTLTEVEHHGHFELTNGKIDENKLFEVVKANNDAYNYSVTFTDAELKNICHILSQNLNYSLSTNPYVDRDALGCFLSDLKIFKENNVTNARITDDGVLAISPDMIDTLQTRIGTLVDAFGLTITHEGGHFGQLNCDDEVDKSEGNRIGFNRKWNDEPVNSLYWNWYFEASAESIMMNQTGEDNLVYSTQISYLNYLETVLSLKADFDVTSLENVSYSRDREDFFALFGDLSDSDKKMLAEVMYAIDLISSDNEEFANAYIAYTESNKFCLQSEDWVKIRRELKAGIGINLSSMFYKNLADAVKEGRMTLKDVYHMITVFEAEIESHNTYDSSNRFDDNKEFMESYVAMQDAFFSSITTVYSYDEVVEGFNVYSYDDGANLNGLSSQVREYVEMRKTKLNEATTTNIRTFYTTFDKQYENKGALVMN